MGEALFLGEDLPQVVDGELVILGFTLLLGALLPVTHHELMQ